MEKCKVDFEAVPWQEPHKGARFKSFSQGNRRLRLFEFSKDFFEPNWCARGHIGYVLEGELEIDFNGEVVRFAKGDGIFIPAGEQNKHKARMLTDTVKLVFAEEV